MSNALEKKLNRRSTAHGLLMDYRSLTTAKCSKTTQKINVVCFAEKFLFA